MDARRSLKAKDLDRYQMRTFLVALGNIFGFPGANFILLHRYMWRMKMKFCTKCETPKDENDFYKRKRGDYFNWCKRCLLDFQTERWIARKIAAVKLLGGACSICGYSKNLASLDFHHIDPKQKDFMWQQMKKQPWDKLLVELKKCTVLCKNCHGEIHNPELAMEVINATNANNHLDKDRVQVFTKLTASGLCPVCNRDVYGTKYCSSTCAHRATRRVNRPSKDELAEDIRNLSWIAIGKKYGVSDNAVRKWARKYDLVT